MKTEDEKNQILFLPNQGWSYGRISRKCKLSKKCVRGICRQRTIAKPKERGQKAIISCGLQIKIEEINMQYEAQWCKGKL